MKVTFEREKLLHAFTSAAAVAPSRSPKPILQNVKMEVLPESVVLMATDLEIGLRNEVGGFEISAPGSVVLPKDRLKGILQETSDEKLSFDCDGRTLLIRGARSEFRLPTENPDEFPTVSPFAEENYHELPAAFFREIVRRTAFATDSESSRYALGGVLLEMAEDKITAVGTDGRRLARQEGPARSVGGHNTVGSATIVPTRAMNVLDRSLLGDGEVQIAARANDLLVQFGKTTIYTRLVEGRFPRWRDVFPKRDNAVRIDLPVGPFLATVRQASVVSIDERKGVEFTFGEGRVVLVGQGGEAGEARVEMPVAYDGAPITITLDPDYLKDFLKVLSPEQNFQFELQDAESAAVCNTDDGYAYVIMPLARDR